MAARKTAKKPKKASTQTTKKKSSTKKTTSTKTSTKSTFASNISERTFSIGIAVFLLLLLAIILVVIVTQQTPSHTTEQGAIVAYINDQPVYEQDIYEVGLAAQQMDGAVSDDVILNQTILIVLLRQEAEQQGITADQQRVEDIFQERRQFIDAQFSSEEFAQLLQSMGLTREAFDNAEYRAIVDDLVINELLEQKVYMHVEPATEQELLEYYNENLALFALPEQRDVSHILICYQGAQNCDTATSAEDAQEQLQLLHAQLQTNPALFEEFAQEYSTEPNAAQTRGNIGFVQRGQLVAPFEDVAFALNVGEISGIVETQFGFHIIRLNDIQQPRTASFDEARDFIEQQLFEEALLSAQQDYLMGLFRNADIRIVQQ